MMLGHLITLRFLHFAYPYSRCTIIEGDCGSIYKLGNVEGEGLIYTAKLATSFKKAIIFWLLKIGRILFSLMPLGIALVPVYYLLCQGKY